MLQRPSLYLALAAAMIAAPAMARPGSWGGDPWRTSGSDNWASSRIAARDSGTAGDAREGKVDVSTFAIESELAAMLGHGTIAVSPITDAPIPPAAGPESLEPQATEDERAREHATYEAAVIDQLILAGYQTGAPNAETGQIAEITLKHAVITPQAAPHKPVSGDTTIGVSNRGTMMGMRLNIDLSKPKQALVSTRLEARVRDRKTGQILWEGRADIVTRKGDSQWSDQEIAARLTEALFARFPNSSG